MAYVDLDTIQTTDPGDVLTAAWCDQSRDNQEFLIDPPACSVFGSGTQSLSDDTTTTMLADSENHDNDSMHSTSSNTGRITAQTAGRYLFTASIEFAANSTGRRLVYLRVNGSTSYLLYSSAAPSSPTTAVGAVTKRLTLAAGDYVEVRANQNTGGAANATLTEFAADFLTR